MSAYQDPSIAKLETQMNKVHAEVDASYVNCDKLIKKIEARHREDDERFKKAETLLAEHKVAIIAPHVLLAAQKLPDIKLKLKVAEYELKRQADECKRLEAKHLDARKLEIRVKKENKQLTKTVESLTAQLDGKTAPEDKGLETENKKLKEELAMLRAQLKTKTDECEMKDAFIASREQDIADLTDDFAAYQSMASDVLSKRHEGCDELHAALDEQCNMLTAERDTLEASLNTLHHKCNTLAIERDNLQGRFDDSIKAHKMELEDYDSLKCEGSSNCISCVLHLERALRMSRAAEAQALQLVDQVDHDRMVAWNQLHEHQTRVVQEHYAAVGSWIATRQTPSVSPTLVSPTFAPSEGGNDGWKICGSSENGSVEFVL